MARRKILITVKTYPTLSRSYDELVCTAGIAADTGEWVRIYPVPFRKLDYDVRFSKFNWIDVNIERNSSDHRRESHKLLDYNHIEIVGSIGTDKRKPHWPERREVVLQNVYFNMTRLIEEAKSHKTSLATFKPAKVIGFKIKEEKYRDWDPKKLAGLEAKRKQMDLFAGGENPFQVVDKIPYKFSYQFVDDAGKESTLKIVDWEIGALFRNCLKKSGGDEAIAVQKVKEKYWDRFVHKTDLYFFLGTTRQFHDVGKNPFIIIGVFSPGNLPVQQELL